MAKYRERAPRVVDAMRYTGWNGSDIMRWAEVPGVVETAVSLVVDTPTGSMRVLKGAWVLRSPSGALSTCSDAEFRETYEEVP